MDPLGLVAVVSIIALIFVAGGDIAGKTESVFHGYFRGVRPDPWPHGVQEEDRTGRWGSPEPASAPTTDRGPEGDDRLLVAPVTTVITAPVRGRVARNSPRA